MSKAEILIVEDEILSAEGLRLELESMEYTVVGIACSGDEAVELATKTNPDLILMDIRLSGEMDGIDAAQRIRARMKVPVIFMTAYADDHLFERARITEPFGFIMKPWDDRDLRYNVEIAVHKHRMEKKLRESEARYRSLVEDMPHLLCRYDDDCRLTYVNDALVAFLGKPRERLLGRNLFSFFPEQERAGIRRQIDSLNPRERIVISEREAVMADGSVRWQRWTNCAIYNAEGMFVEYQSIGEDISDIRQLEQEVIRIAEEERRRISLDLHDSLGQKLAYLGFLVEMHKKKLIESQGPDLTGIEVMATQIRDAVDHVRTIAKGLQPITMDPYGFVDAVEEYVRETNRVLSVGINLSREGDIAIEDPLTAMHLYYMIQEAILNALKHGKRSGIEVRIRMENESLNIGVVNTIDDTGPARTGPAGIGRRLIQYRGHLIGANVHEIGDEKTFGLEVVIDARLLRGEKK